MSLATRLHMTKLALALVEDECARATRKHGPMRSHHEAFAVLKEEVDELWADVMRDRHGDASREAIQVAAMAVRMLVDVSTWEPCEIDGFKLGPTNKEIEQAAAAAEAEAARGRALDAEQTTTVLEEAVQALGLAADRISDLERRLAALETGAAVRPRYDIDALVAGITPENLHGEYLESSGLDEALEEHEQGFIPYELLDDQAAHEQYLRETEPVVVEETRAAFISASDRIKMRRGPVEERSPADDILARIRGRIGAKRAEATPEPVVVDTDEFLADRGVSADLRDQLTAWMQRKEAYAADHGPGGVSRDQRRAEIADRSEVLADEIMAETDRARAAEIDAIRRLAGIYPMTDPYDCVGKDEACENDDEYPVTLGDEMNVLVAQVNVELDSLENGLDDVRTTVDEMLPVLNATGIAHDATMLRVDRLEEGFDRLLDVQERISEVHDARGTLIENRLDKVEDGIQGLDDKVYDLGCDLKELIAATVDLAVLVKKISQGR